MRRMSFGLVAGLFIAVGAASAQDAAPLIPTDIAEAMKAADVVILGEIHDNPAHHKVQEAAITLLEPSAVVWEMLTEVGARRIDAALIAQPEEMAKALDWADQGWPEFDMYHPIFSAAPEGARIYGGNVPRAAAMAAIDTGEAVAFGADAARFGLTVPLPAAERAEREAAQMLAHCDAIPQESLGAMVRVQRLRDAVLARAVIAAMDETGGPVAVITGNGHARADWGIPVYLRRVRPDLRIFVLGQSEDGQIEGAFDAVIDSPPVPREDPCAVFAKPD